MFRFNEADNYVAIGNGITRSTGSNQVALGSNITLGDDLTTAVGVSADATGYQTTAIGTNTSATANNSVAIGVGATATASRTLALGYGVENSVVGTTSLIGNVKYTRSFVDSATTPRYSIDNTDEVVGVDTSSASVTVVLSGVASDDNGHNITIKDEGGNAGTNVIILWVRRFNSF